MQEAEGECHDPGMAERQAGRATVRAYGFRRDKQDGERSQRIDERCRDTQQAQNGGGERQAVRNRESAHRLEQRAPVFDDEQQAQQEQKMIRPQRNVTDPEHEKVRCGQAPLAHMDRQAGILRMQEFPNGIAVCQTDGNQSVGDRPIKAFHREPSSLQAGRTRIQIAPAADLEFRGACNGAGGCFQETAADVRNQVYGQQPKGGLFP